MPGPDGVRRVVFASGNQGKAREVRALFLDLFGSDVELVLQTELGVPSIPETGSTFRANALLKARHAASVTGLAALADDSGLEVDALNGAPGVYSARYAGPAATDSDNVEKLLVELDGERNRGARFRCVLAFVRGPEDSSPVFAEGAWEGSIATSARGARGFGYDPVFIDAESGMTAAELDPTAKNARSHRGSALAGLRDALRAGL